MNASSIYALFECAVSHDLKFPKIRLQAANGGVVVLKLNGPKSKYQGSIAVTDDRPFGENSYYGRIERNGAWIPGRDSSPAIVVLLEELAQNPAEVAARYGKLTGNCCFCQTALRDARSTAVGYGPICAEHFGLPWGSDFVATPETREEDLQRDIFTSRVAIREAAETVLARVDHTNINTPIGDMGDTWNLLREALPSAESNPFAAVEFCETNDTPEALLNDPCTPFWAADVIRVALTRDCVDAANVFAVLAKSFDARAKKILGQ